MSEVLDNISRELRAAVLAGDHALAERRFCEYAQTVAQIWRALSESDRRASTLPQTVHELITWIRGMTIVQRAISAEQLAAVEQALRYQASYADTDQVTFRAQA